jgi:hypothetical protein
MYRFILFLILVIASSCSESEPVIPQESELITNMIYTLRPTAGGPPVIFSFEDSDGDGGANPIIISEDLEANKEYMGTIELFNSSGISIQDITEEIRDESQEHQFFFKTTKSDLSITYQDLDPDGNPIGLLTKLNSGNTGIGVLTITLRHEPNKFGPNVNSGNIENAGGETDIEIEFIVNVQ